MWTSVRAYEKDDLGGVLDLWQRVGVIGEKSGFTVDEAVDVLTNSDTTIRLVAEIGTDLVAVSVGTIRSTLGWVDRITVLPELVGADDIADQLLTEVEQALADAGARRLGVLTGDDDPSREHLERWDFHSVDGTRYKERLIPASCMIPSLPDKAYGRFIDPGLWDELKGLEQAKEIIERRVILPLEEPGLAARHALAPPKAIVLFGPPGTGKTTFAKGIASRLRWPFLEIEPRELAGDGPDGEAKVLAEMFDNVRELGSAVIFVDEVEDLAAIRDAERRVSASITNEFLRQIPRIRELPNKLLVCATNWIDRLDPAFVRPGRFDYVLPVGPPDENARRAIWERYVGEITDELVDLDSLVEASAMFTPADIEFSARKAAQHAFEREHFGEASHRAYTADFLGAIKVMRPTLSAELLERFEADRKEFSRY